MTADTAMWNRDGMESLTTLGPNLASAVITAGGSRNGRGFAMMMYVSYFFLLAFLSPIIFCCRCGSINLISPFSYLVYSFLMPLCTQR